jgi:hypothetical protein
MSLVLVLAAGAFALPALGDDVPSKPKEPAKAKDPLRRVVHSIEIATHSKEPFGGAVTLKLAEGDGPMLTFYWGGQCKKTKITTARLDLLSEAMHRGWPVEIPSFPIKHNDRIHMCMRSIRVLRD